MTVSFLDKIKLTYEQILEKYIPITLQKYNVQDLDIIIDEILHLKTKGHYQKLVETCLIFDKYYDQSLDVDQFIMRTAKKGREILGYQPINLPPFTRVIAYQDLLALYNLLGGIYVTCIGRQLNQKETNNINDNIELRIMQKLNKFDEISPTPTINNEFFHNLHKIKWKNKKSRYLWLELSELLKYAGFPKRRPVRFDIEQALATQFLSACSAVNNNQTKITEEDVITGFKTYFKLLETNMPLLVEKLKEN